MEMAQDPVEMIATQYQQHREGRPRPELPIWHDGATESGLILAPLPNCGYQQSDAELRSAGQPRAAVPTWAWLCEYVDASVYSNPDGRGRPSLHWL